MSVESPSNAGSSRALRPEEQDLVKALLTHVPGGADLAGALTGCQVVDLADGGMGSVQFLGPGPRKFGTELVSAEYVDQDGTLVIISLYADIFGNLYEIDSWKVDFSKLLRYPTPADLTVTSNAA